MKKIMIFIEIFLFIFVDEDSERFSDMLKITQLESGKAEIKADFFDPSGVTFSLKQRTIEELLKQQMESCPAT